MKLAITYKKIVLSSILLLLSACTTEVPLKESQLDVSVLPMTPLDNWIETNYVNSYNIRIIYRWNQNTVDYNRFLYPPTQEKVQPVLKLIKKIWIDSYTSVGGADFIKKFAPRELVLVGGINLSPTGTSQLGLADVGQRVTLFQIDDFNFDAKLNHRWVLYFISTILHEYIHILNNFKPFDREAFIKITPELYTADWYHTRDTDALMSGIITAYAKSNVDEDFAEMASTLLKLTPEEFDRAIKNGQPNQDIIIQKFKAKEALVVKYFKEAFNIDFNQLRVETNKNIIDVVKNGIN